MLIVMKPDWPARSSTVVLDGRPNNVICCEMPWPATAGGGGDPAASGGLVPTDIKLPSCDTIAEVELVSSVAAATAFLSSVMLPMRMM